MKYKSVKFPGSSALKRIQKFFPNVTNVTDADEDIVVDVTSKDERESKKKNHSECALATACKRQEKAQGVIVSVSTAYVIKGDTATRFKVPEHASREVVSFDRNGGFEPGKYKLNAPCQADRLENLPYKNRQHSERNKTDRKFSKRFVHKTERIRTSLVQE